MKKTFCAVVLMGVFGLTGAEYFTRELAEKIKDKDLTFAVTFDNWGVNADKAGGNPLSITMKNTGLKLRGEVGFDGHQAFRPLPGEDLKFEAVGNADPHEGTLIMWSKAVDYSPNDPSKQRGNTSLGSMYFRQGKDYIRYILYVYRDEVVFEWWSSAPPSNFRGVGRVRGSLKNIRQNQWYQVAVTWKQDRLVLYLNGEKQTECRLQQKYIKTAHLKPERGTSFIGIKSRFYDDKHKWATAVDDFMIYSRALSLSEIRKQYLTLKKDKKNQVINDYEVTLNGVVDDKSTSLDRLEAEFDFSGLPEKYAGLLAQGKLRMEYLFTSPDGKKQSGFWMFGKDGNCRILKGVSGVGECSLKTSIDGKKYQTAVIRRPDLTFAYNNLGISDTPPDVLSDFAVSGRKVRLWNREYQFGSGPLPEAIRIGGKKLFAKPPELIFDGKTVVWEKGKDFSDRKSVTYCGHGRCGSFSVDYQTRVECDGMIQFSWTVNGKPVLEKMELVWRLDKIFCDYLMIPVLETRQGSRFAYTYPFSSAGASLLWLAAEKQGGFAYSMENDANWVYNPEKPVFFVDRAAGECRVMMIGEKGKVVLPEKTEYSALFIATPTRPFPKKLRGIRYGDLSKLCYPRFGFTMNAGLDGIFTFSPHPTDFEYRMQRFPPGVFTCYGAADSLTEASDLVKYFRKYADFPGATVYPMNALECTSTPGKYVRKVYNSVPFCGRTRIIYDYYLWNQNRMFQHKYGDRVACINYDLIGNGCCRNRLHGCSFTDRFGREIHSFQLLQKRKLAMRSLTFLHANGRELDLHCQNQFNPFIHGLCDTWSTGEQVDALCNLNLFCYIDDVPEKIYRSEFNRDLLGVRVIALPQLAQARRGFVYRDEHSAYSEAMLAEFLVQDIEFQAIWMHQKTARKVWDIFDKYLMGDPRCCCWRYYEPDNPVKSLNPSIRVTAYKTPHAWLLIISNQKKTPQDAVIDVGGIISKKDVFTEEYAQTPVRKDEAGNLHLSVPARSFRILVSPHRDFYPYTDSMERCWQVSLPKNSDTVFRHDKTVGNPAPPSLLYIRGPSGKNSGSFHDTFPVEPGGKYLVSWKVRHEKAEFAVAVILALNEKGAILRNVRQFRVTRFKLTSGWQELKLPLEIPADGNWKNCRFIKLNLSVAGKNSKTWIDDFRIEKQPAEISNSRL